VRMPVVYVAGPYRGINRDAVELNIQSAKAVGLEAIKKGWSPIIPHMNTAHLDAITSLDDNFWLEATMELLRRSDAVVLCAGWNRSTGTIAEIEEARKLKIPLRFSVNQLPEAEIFIDEKEKRFKIITCDNCMLCTVIKTNFCSYCGHKTVNPL
jgi:hypothetical protein